MFRSVLKSVLAALFAACVLTGCLPSGHSQLDEEKEPHYLAGKSRVSAMDYGGAIESFSKAVEVNPRSGAAHLELGWLYDQKQGDPAAAIYHYNKYLQLRPKADNIDTIKTRVLACKQELARTVSLGPVTQAMQKEFEQLALNNKKLQDEVEKWKAYAESLQALTNRAASPPSRSLSEPQGSRPTPGPALSQSFAPGGSRGTTGSSQGRTSQPEPASRTGRTHTVRAGDTPAQIARHYSVKLSALMEANPRLDPRRMKVGDVLRIP